MAGRAAAAAAAVLCAVGLVAGCGRETVADGVRVGTLDVGGLEAGEARARIAHELAGAVGAPLTVTYHDRRFVLRPQDAQARIDRRASVAAALAADDGTAVAPRLALRRGRRLRRARRAARRAPRARCRHRLARRQAPAHARPRRRAGPARAAERRCGWRGALSEQRRAPHDRRPGHDQRAPRPHAAGPRRALPGGHRRRP